MLYLFRHDIGLAVAARQEGIGLARFFASKPLAFGSEFEDVAPRPNDLVPAMVKSGNAALAAVARFKKPRRVILMPGLDRFHPTPIHR
jgi:hypothetical protein